MYSRKNKQPLNPSYGEKLLFCIRGCGKVLGSGVLASIARIDFSIAITTEKTACQAQRDLSALQDQQTVIKSTYHIHKYGHVAYFLPLRGEKNLYFITSVHYFSVI